VSGLRNGHDEKFSAPSEKRMAVSFHLANCFPWLGCILANTGKVKQPA
jgi:hypothetical protein